jgi:hypothetical protein
VALEKNATADATARYRQVLEAVLAAEEALKGAAMTRRDALGAELASMDEGSRARKGYRLGGDDPAAISRRV